MTELSRKILRDWQVRKTKRQKTAFIEFLKSELGEENVRVEKSGLLGSRNIVLGGAADAQYILAAHYDTQPVMPFPNFLAPKNLPVYIGYTLLLCLGFFGIAFALGFVCGMLSLPSWIASLLSEAAVIGILALLLLGPANRHTANDNTSGVITVLEAYQNEAIRSQAAFVLFDHEELGLFGSAAFAKAHKAELAGKLLLNFDCVGDGDTVMLILSREAEDCRESLEKAFFPEGEKEVRLERAKGTLYPSDQMNFKRSIGVAAFCRHPRIGLYLSRIHTKKDTVCEEENIALLVRGIGRLCQ